MEQVVHAEYARSLANHWWFRARRKIFARLLDSLVPLPRQAQILELGPGHGVNLEVLNPRGRVTTLDTDKTSLADCLERGAHGAVLADGLEPPFRPRTFDLICALDVIEHIDDDQQVLRRIHELLRPGARLFLTVPALSILWGRQDVLSRHFRRYSKRQLKERVQAAGFSIERLSFFNSALFLPILFVRLLMRPFLRRSTRAGSGSDFSVRPPGVIEGIFYKLFAAEAGWLVRRDLPIGVSLLCIAKRESS